MKKIHYPLCVYCICICTFENDFVWSLTKKSRFYFHQFLSSKNQFLQDFRLSLSYLLYTFSRNQPKKKCIYKFYIWLNQISTLSFPQLIYATKRDTCITSIYHQNGPEQLNFLPIKLFFFVIIFNIQSDTRVNNNP